MNYSMLKFFTYYAFEQCSKKLAYYAHNYYNIIMLQFMIIYNYIIFNK